ncbi:MAG: hypothetical protein NXH83_01840 [Rhodobacteraceae bacterium]|nr:hypothetical protein [Paracoccaceae bacterium]
MRSAAFIPRETVRRKVNTLVAKGWVVRRGDGSLAVQKQAAQDLEDATGDTVAYLTVMFQAFGKVRADRAEP